MAREEYWLNSDGLRVGNGPIDRENPEGGIYRTTGLRKQIKGRIVDATTLGDTDTAAVEGEDMPIPAGAVILGGYIEVIEAFTSAGAAVLDVGLKEKDGTAIDDDGLDAAVALGALGAGDTVELDGALIGERIGDEPGYFSYTYDTAAFTAGKAIVVVEFAPAPGVS